VTSPEFTGERLHDESELFGADLARHRAAYEFAASWLDGARVLDLGSGSGYGTAELPSAAAFVVGLDRVRPDAHGRASRAAFVRADLRRVPLASAHFDLVLSFQVIEHLDDPSEYLTEIARVLRPGGVALISTPNRLTSDGVNPFHMHEYVADELTECLACHFGAVEMLGVGSSPAAARYLEARLLWIRRLMRIDPLGLHRRLPRSLVDGLFGRLAVLVRRVIRKSGEMDELTTRDFPIGESRPDDVDLIAVCRNPLHPGSDQSA